jgi:hypothetical protein
MKSLTVPKFWKSYFELSSEIKVAAKKQFRFWKADQSHPSVQFKKVGLFWAARVTEDYRALCYKEGEDFYWFWIGKHSEYEKKIKQK